MNRWNLVYCFTKRLSKNEQNFKNILYSLKKSVELASRFHNIRIITDENTINFLDDIGVQKQIYDFGELRFLDDIKISVLPHILENEILIDPDVFLYKELRISSDCDLYAERPESIRDEWYKNDYEPAKKFKFSKYIDFYSESGNVSNIGILKFFNQKLLNEYISKYNLVKEIALSERSKLEPFPKYSILLGQLLLQNIIDYGSYTVKYVRSNPYNEYYHLAGENKYERGFLEEKLEKKNEDTLI